MHPRSFDIPALAALLILPAWDECKIDARVVGEVALC